MKPIKPIRFVNNELYSKISTNTVDENVGYMAIDQARQLYLMSSKESAVYNVPLIGM